MEQDQIFGTGLKQVQLAAVREIFRAAAAALPLPEILPIITNVTIIAFDARSAWLMQVEDDRLRTQVARGELAGTLMMSGCMLGDGAAGIAALGDRPVILAPGAISPTDPVLGMLAGRPEPVVLMPIVAGGRRLGLLGAAVSLEAAQDISFLVMLAEQAALVIENARLRGETLSWRERMDAVIDQLQQLVLLFDRNGTLVLLNANASAWLSLWDVHPGDTISSVARKLGLHNRQGKPFGEADLLQQSDAVEQRLLLPDGAERFYLVSVAPLMINGQTDGATLIFHDITAQKQAEATQVRLRKAAEASAHQVAEERALLDTLIATAPIGVALLDTELRFLRLNERLAEINGLPVAAHLGHSVREILPRLAEIVEPVLRQVLETGEAVLDWEITGETPALPGVTRIWRESFYPVRTGDGRMIGVGTIVAEITEYRRLSANLRDQAEQLRLSEQRFRIALDNMPISVWSQDCNLRYLWVYNLTNGYLPEQLLGRTDEEVFERAEDAATLRAIKERVLTTGKGTRQEVSVQHEGQLFIYDLIVEPLHNAEGTISGITCAAIDVTERQRAEAERARLLATAEAALQSRDELTALLSHDLKNPLTAVLGQAQLMRRRLKGGELDPARILDGVGRVEASAIQMHALLDELLDMARIQAGHDPQMKLQPLDLILLIRRVIERMQVSSEQHEIRLISEIPDLRTICDQRRIERVMENLLSNAVKYSPAGSTVSIAIERQDTAERAWAVVAVTDQGIGIPAADMPRIFERFHRASNTNGRIQGTGLGLASVRRIVEQHGGTIEVSSSEGQGSTFTFRLPLG